MGISAVGQDERVSTLRHAVATVLVAVGLFAFFYGPPLAPNMSAAARDACNEMTGSDYRSFSLVWKTTTYDSIDTPHWVCYDLGEPGHPGDQPRLVVRLLGLCVLGVVPQAPR